MLICAFCARERKRERVRSKGKSIATEGAFPQRLDFFPCGLIAKKAFYIRNATANTYRGPSPVKPVGYFCFLPQNPKFEFISAEA